MNRSVQAISGKDARFRTSRALRRHGYRVLALAAVALLLAAAGLVLAGAPDLLAPEYAIDWWTVDGGGGTSAAGTYTLSGTAGQPDAGAEMAHGPYLLVGGFWPAGTRTYPIYLPLVIR